GDRERAAVMEIRQAASALACQAQLVVLARQRVESFHVRVKEMEDKSKQGLASFVEVTQAHLEWLRARGDLIKEVMAWHIARVKLKQAQGILAAECGFEGCG